MKTETEIKWLIEEGGHDYSKGEFKTEILDPLNIGSIASLKEFLKHKGDHIIQLYLEDNRLIQKLNNLCDFYVGYYPEYTYRVRLVHSNDGESRLIYTVKGPKEGYSREEMEKELSNSDIPELKELIYSISPKKDRYIVKKRYRMPCKFNYKYSYEIDYILDPLDMVIIELEHPNPEQIPVKIGRDVSFSPLYSNSNLANYGRK